MRAGTARLSPARPGAGEGAYPEGPGIGVGGWMPDVYLGDEGSHAPWRPAGRTVGDVPCGRDHAAAAAVREHPPRQIVRRPPLRAVLTGGRPRALPQPARAKSPGPQARHSCEEENR